MATAVFRQNTTHPTMHMLPMRMSAGLPTQQHQQQQEHSAMQHASQHHNYHPYHQPVALPAGKRRAIAPASAQHPRSIAPLHPANGQQMQQQQRPQPAHIQPKSTTNPKPSTVSSRMPFTHHQTMTTSTTVSSTSYPYGVPMPPGAHQPASVQRRNARERNRVKQVNNGFTNLRQHIPSDVISALTAETGQTVGRGASKKLSKVDTLKLAVEYIRRLQELIDETDSIDGSAGMTSLCSGNSNSSRTSYYSESSPASSLSSSSCISTAPTMTTTSAEMLLIPDQNSSVDSQRCAATVSPAPSLLSDVSSVYSTVHSITAGPASSICSSHSSSNVDAAAAVAGATATAGTELTVVPPYKYEPYDAAYNAEDEELLDCISWWQQQ